VRRVSRGLDRVGVDFDDESLVANAGLLLTATMAARLDLEALINMTVRLVGRVGGHRPGRKVMTLVHSIIAGGSHIDHADVLRAGATERVLGHRVMAPSTLGTFLRSFTFGHVRQLEAVIGMALTRAWALGANSPGDNRLVIDVDSTICEVYGRHKQGAAYGYTKVLGYHPILATRADTGEVLHARMRKGSANTARGVRRFCDELIARVRRAGASGPIVIRFDSGFWSAETIKTLARHHVSYTMAVRTNTPKVAAAIAEIPEEAWAEIAYTPDGRAQVAECLYAGQRLIVRRTRLTGAAKHACGPTGATSGSSPTSPTPTPLPSTGSTGRTPPSSSPSETSKKAPASNTSRPATSRPTRSGWAAPFWPTTLSAGLPPPPSPRRPRLP
jgi:hypothetical protein